MRKKNYTKHIKRSLLVLVICYFSFSGFSQSNSIYVNDMDYVIGDVKQAFITNKITSEEQADNLLKGFVEMKVNGIRIPLFGRGVDGVDLNPNKPIMDYFYNEALSQGFDIFANPAQGGGGKRVANNRLNGNGSNEGPDSPVNGVQAATDELIARVLEFSDDYPDCKWLNPFNEDGRATNSTWSVNQINEIYAALYNNVNGAELIGPCTWGLPAGKDMFENTNIADYITVAATHNLGFHHGQWDDFINLATNEGLPVWDSEVNHNDAQGNGTRLEKAIENKVDGLVLYNSWNTISYNNGNGSVNAAGEEIMELFLKERVNLALSGMASQSSTNTTFNKPADLAIDGDTNGNYGGGSVTVTDSEENPWWQVDFGSDQTIAEVKLFNRTDNCCRDRMSNVTISVIDSNGDTTYTKTYTDYPDPSVTAITGDVQGQIVKVQLNGTAALTIAEVKVFGTAQSGLSVEENSLVNIKMYPNPVSDKLTVKAPNTMLNKYTVYNVNGQVMMSDKLYNNSTEIEIDLSALSKGLYMLKIEDSNISKTYKVFKN